MPVIFPTFLFPDAELGDSIGRTLQKILTRLGAVKAPLSGTALASAARTLTTFSTDIPTTGYKGVNVFLNVTAAAGVGGLRAFLMLKCPVTGTYRGIVGSTTNITATGMYAFCFGPGLGGLAGAALGVTQCGVAAVNLSANVQLMIFPATADSYTYSVHYELIP